MLRSFLASLFYRTTNVRSNVVRDLSAKWLALRGLGEFRATINRIEQGHAQSVTFEVINKLARALAMDADVLVTFEK